jgi:hypothetical protein
MGWSFPSINKLSEKGGENLADDLIAKNLPTLKTG